MNQAPRLHIVGCGRAARSVARRLIRTGRVQPGLVVNRSLDSAREATDFLGGGEAAGALDARIAGGWLMLGLPDGLLADADALGTMLRGFPAVPGLVFHLSGSVEAGVLRCIGAPAAAVHPVRAFAEPESASRRFDGTWCVAEGDAAALDRLEPVFEAAGARWLAFEARDKAAWHAATVAASNYLATIQDLSRALAERAGLPSEQAADILGDLQQGMLDSLRECTPREALTGPIERGDEAACARVMAAADALDSGRARLFADLATATLALARDKRGDRDSDRVLARLFRAIDREMPTSE